MPLFAIIAHDVANSSDQRQACRHAHIERLRQLDSAGRLVIAGPTPIEHLPCVDPSVSLLQPMSGSIIIADFESLQAAQDWANADPYFISGVYSHIDIKPFLPALPQVTTL